jgi:hypothetical protein
VHNELWNALLGLDHAEICVRAQCQCAVNSAQMEIVMLNRVYRADLEKRDVHRLEEHAGPVSAEFLEQLCILSYLIHAKNRPLAGKLVKGEQLDAGQFFFRGPHGLPLKPLEQAFGTDPQRLIQLAQPLGARECSFGDASVEIPLFSRVPVTFILWAGDDEFPARASILFDETASTQLPLDALLAAVNLAVTAIT